MMNVQGVREYFQAIKGDEARHLRMPAASFYCSQNFIFGKPNQNYIRAEIEWYESQSRNVNDLFELYGKEVAIWKQVADEDGFINSNYGWMIYSAENDFQYQNCLNKLIEQPDSRQGIMIYQHPSMHYRWDVFGKHDFCCTNAVHYSVRDKKLTVVVQMRSNDAVYGFNNDVAWQRHVASKLMKDLQEANVPVIQFEIYWQVADFHVYPRHWDLV